MHTFRNILSDYLTRCNSLQVMSESFRQSLAKNSYFQHETIFERLDKHHKGYLIPADFSEFLLENKVYPSEQELYILFRDFDVDRIGTITLEMFKRQILPKENEKLVKQVNTRKYYPSRQRLQLDLEYLLMKYFQHKIKTHNELQLIRHQLQQIHPNYSSEAFLLIDRNKKNQIIPADIDYFLRSNAKLLKSQEINRIFKVISNISNKTSPYLISQSKFIQHLSPFASGFYLGYAQRLVQKQNLYKQHISRKILMNEILLKNEKKQIEARMNLQYLRNSRKFIERKLFQQEMRNKY